MDIVQGISAVIFDKMNEPYFLVLHRNSSWKGWEFIRGLNKDGESEEYAIGRNVYEIIGIKKMNILKKLPTIKEFLKDGKLHRYNVYLVETNMNTPVHLRNYKYDNYLWTTKERILEKLQWANDKEIFEKALTEITNLPKEKK